MKTMNAIAVYEETVPQQTRQLCYRKDDRAMRPIYGCPKNFRDSRTMPTAILSPNFSWAFVLIMVNR